MRCGGKEEKGKEGGKEPSGGGCPLSSSLRRDGGRTGTVGGRGGSAGSLMIYLDPGAPVPVSR